MKGYQFTSGCCLILFGLIALQAQFAGASYSMSETCQYYSKGYIADPDSCQGWGYCSGGALKGTGKCNDGFLFDTTTGTCNYANKTQCASKLEATCALISNPVYVANPEDCSQACYCNNGTYACVTCPQYQYFDPTKRACVYTKDYACPANSICRLVPNNQFVGDPDQCGNYLQCSAGAGTSTPCTEAGYYYDPLNNYCSNQNVCANTPTVAPPASAGPGIAANLLDNPKICSTIPSGKTSYFFSDDQTCFGYYVCESTSGSGTWFKCPMGTHFDEATQECVTPYTVACQKDRCGNINQSFVAALGCKSYDYCINQTKQSGLGNTCADISSTYTFFDEFQGACVNTDPAYAICKATASS